MFHSRTINGTDTRKHRNVETYISYAAYRITPPVSLPSDSGGKQSASILLPLTVLEKHSNRNWTHKSVGLIHKRLDITGIR